MKKIWMVLYFVIGVLVGCQPAQENATVQQPAWNPENKIWIITDLHYISPTLYDDGEAFQRIKMTAAGKDLVYGQERMEMLIYQIERDKPTLLIVSGDLTLNGEYQSMLELQEYFSRIEQLGTQVLVIPGNHDVSSGWASEFVADETNRVRQVLPSDFKELFAEFGYQQATTSDSASLSYMTEVADDLWILMIDSNNYAQGEGVGPPTTAGDVKDQTLRWIATELQRAKDHGARVIPIVHHNSLVHFQMLAKNYTLDNAAEFQQVLKTAGIPVTFSGHIHAQHIQTESGLTDIVTGAFSIYPSAIGEIHLNADNLTYQRIMLAGSDWAQATGQTNPDLLHFQEYMKRMFEEDAQRMMYGEMIEGNWYEEGKSDSVAQFFGELNRSFFAGELSNDYERLVSTYQEDIQQINEKAAPRFNNYLQFITEQKTHQSLYVEVKWPQP